MYSFLQKTKWNKTPHKHLTAFWNPHLSINLALLNPRRPPNMGLVSIENPLPWRHGLCFWEETIVLSWEEGCRGPQRTLGLVQHQGCSHIHTGPHLLLNGEASANLSSEIISGFVKIKSRSGEVPRRYCPPCSPQEWAELSELLPESRHEKRQGQV